MNQMISSILWVALMLFHKTAALDLTALPYPEEATMSTGSVITSYGYPLEIHYVTTKDGYILKVYRIPFGTHCEGNKRKKPYPVIAVHGLLSTSKQFVITRKGFAFLAADDCYDVWLPNTRGNYESRNHTFLNPDGTRFWEFDIYEKAIYDIPAVIEYVLLETNAPQVQYVGHSQATAIAFILTSLYPEYSEGIIKSVHALSPIAFTTKSPNPLNAVISAFLPSIQNLLKKLGIVEVPRSKYLPLWLREFPCRLQDPVSLNPCAQILFPFTGDGTQEFNVTSFMIGMTFFFAGSSIRELIIPAQWHFSGKFTRYDYFEDNEKVYGQPTPPEYPIENIRVPIYLYIGENDIISDIADVKLFYELTPTSIWVDNSDFANFNHVDFVIAQNVDILNRKVLENLAIYN